MSFASIIIGLAALDVVVRGESSFAMKIYRSIQSHQESKENVKGRIPSS